MNEMDEVDKVDKMDACFLKLLPYLCQRDLLINN